MPPGLQYPSLKMIECLDKKMIRDIERDFNQSFHQQMKFEQRSIRMEKNGEMKNNGNQEIYIQN